MPDATTLPRPPSSAADRVRRRNNGDTLWFVPGRKTPIAYTTRSTSDLIGLLADEGLTFAEAHDVVLYDDEALAVLDIFIGRGHANTKMREMGVRYA